MTVLSSGTAQYVTKIDPLNYHKGQQPVEPQTISRLAYLFHFYTIKDTPTIPGNGNTASS